MRGLMPRMFFAFAHACDTRVPFKLCVICTVCMFMHTYTVILQEGHAYEWKQLTYILLVNMKPICIEKLNKIINHETLICT